jgi:5,10-methylene-tetrahydrofolate dehydrogenase/methenyl tetrahydrofolate cyclohydrolase
VWVVGRGVGRDGEERTLPPPPPPPHTHTHNLPLLPVLLFLFVIFSLFKPTLLLTSQMGFLSKTQHFPEAVTTEEVIATIDEFNDDPDIHGILVQMPLPPHLDRASILNRIHISKDVDGFHPYNVGCLALQRAGPPAPFHDAHDVQDLMTSSANVACTSQGVIEMLDRYGIELKGKRVGM